jgi:hypothetical protein
VQPHHCGCLADEGVQPLHQHKVASIHTRQGDPGGGGVVVVVGRRSSRGDLQRLTDLSMGWLAALAWCSRGRCD